MSAYVKSVQFDSRTPDWNIEISRSRRNQSVVDMTPSARARDLPADVLEAVIVWAAIGLAFHGRRLIATDAGLTFKPVSS